MNNLFVRFYVGVVAALALAAVLLLISAGRRSGAEETAEEREQHAVRRSEHYVELSHGYHRLMQKSLLARPPGQWEAVVAEWQRHFRYPIALKRTDETLDPALPAFVRRRIEAGQEAAWSRVTGPTSETLTLYLPLAGSGRVLVQDMDLGPPVDVMLEFIGPDVLALLAILGLAILLLTRPLARHVNRLADVASAFGLGQLDARVSTAAPEPIAHLARTFNAMAERIQRASDEQQATLQAISHELRTPIARLHFALEAAGAALGECQAGRAHIEGMAKDIGEIETLVEELLTYARLQPGAPPLELVALDLVDLVEAIVQDLSPLSPHLTIEVDAPAPAACAADARHLGRAISNVLRNAQRHASTRIRVRLSSSESGSTVVVDDDGPGIPAEQRERVFLPFERLDSSRRRTTGGHGLGLAIVHRVMQAHGGTARAEASDLGGARLVLAWPRPSEGPPAPRAGERA